MLKGCLIGGAVVVGLVIVAVVVVAVMVSRQPDLSGIMTPVEVSVMAAQDLDSKIDRFKKDLASAPSGTPVTIELTQDEVTSKIDVMLKTGSARAPVRDVTVNFREGMVRVCGVLGGGGGGRSFVAEGTLKGNENNLCVSIRSIRMGVLPLPPGLVEGLISCFAPGFDLSRIPLPVEAGTTITGVTVGEGVAILEATAR